MLQKLKSAQIQLVRPFLPFSPNYYYYWARNCCPKNFVQNHSTLAKFDAIRNFSSQKLCMPVDKRMSRAYMCVTCNIHIDRQRIWIWFSFIISSQCDRVLWGVLYHLHLSLAASNKFTKSWNFIATKTQPFSAQTNIQQFWLICYSMLELPRTIHSYVPDEKWNTYKYTFLWCWLLTISFEFSVRLFCWLNIEHHQCTVHILFRNRAPHFEYNIFAVFCVLFVCQLSIFKNYMNFSLDAMRSNIYTVIAIFITSFIYI